MGAMAEDPLPPPPSTIAEACYRHPGNETRVHCTRCGRPICPECMVPAPVGFQCPECVAEARREFRRGPGRPLRGGIDVTRTLLAAIIAMFVIELATGAVGLMSGGSERKLIQLGAMQPILIANGQYWRLFSAMFLHANLLHIAFNGYALYLFGRFIESNFGKTRFTAIYFVTGFLASATSYAFGSLGDVGVGASGAIFGIFGAFIAYNYKRRHLAMSAQNLRWAMSMLVLNAILAFSFGAIDWRAHVGGLVAGLAAGVVAEGWGTRQQRRTVQIAGFLVIVAIGVALVVWRTNDIRQLQGFQQCADSIRSCLGV
jgi:membrane associated rhomboid family serine protease